jgi:hypothetical protein
MNSMTTRRTFLRGAGVAIALPYLEYLESLLPCGAATVSSRARRRMIAINIGLGLHGPNIIPTRAGREYELPIYLKILGEYRDQFTVMSGVSHPEVGGGHLSYKSFLTCAPHPNSAGFRNTISLDQFAAAQLGTETRFASLSLSTSGPGLSWSRSGVEIPTYRRPSLVYQKLFVDGSPEEVARRVERMKEGQSVLDVVMDKTRRMKRRLGGRDREKLDQYFEAVREAERRLLKAEAWEHRPKPKVDAEQPRDHTDPKEMIGRMRLLYDVMHLAIESDSTRFVTCNFPGMNAVPVIPGIDVDYHNLSHHAKDPAKVKQLTIVESAVVNELAEFLKKLDGSAQGDGSLLDSTMVLFGSNLGNASSHDTKNMPIVLAGGGFDHGQHLAFDRKDNYPLPNLYVSMLQRLGMETDRFGTGSATMRGLNAT